MSLARSKKEWLQQQSELRTQKSLNFRLESTTAAGTAAAPEGTSGSLEFVASAFGDWR